VDVAETAGAEQLNGGERRLGPAAAGGRDRVQGLLGGGEVTLNDAYFMSLVSFNGKFSLLNPQGVTNKRMTGVELATFRLLFMLLNYSISYLFFPRRILRTLRNVITGKGSATVFENRLQDAFHRRKAASAAHP